MINEGEKIHPAAAVLIGLALWLSIGARTVVIHGYRGAFIYAVVSLWLIAIIYAGYEMLTLPSEIRHE